MDKKTLIIVMSVLVMVFGLIMGLIVYLIVEENRRVAESEKEQIVNEIKYSGVNEDVITNSQEEKVVYDAEVILKHEYLKCGHIVEEILKDEVVNKTKSEIEEMYSQYEVIQFSPQKIVLLDSKDEQCEEHYVVRLEESVITVFTENEYGQLSLYNKTGIYEDYLTEADKEELINGIYVIGKVELNLLLEDYH